MLRIRLITLLGLLALPAAGTAQELLFGLDAANSQILQIDPLFDLNGNGTVDFDDFFIFADSFGREVVTQ